MTIITRLSPIIILIGLVAGCTPASSKVPISNAAGAPTVEFRIPDMMCEEGCAMTVKDILSRQPGAKEVLVDFEAKTATVAIERGKFDPHQAIAALIDKGFDHSELVSEDAAAKPQAAAESAAHESASVSSGGR